MIVDRLFEDINNKGHVCVGLDTDVSYIPKRLLDESGFIGDAIFEFNRRIIDATHDIAGCFKIQIAYYEAYGMQGLSAYKKTLEYARKKGSVVISDIKRGDIAKTAEMYAKAHFEGDFETDMITLNPYMGMDSIEPYLQYVENKNKGLFVLVRTSNKGAKDVEYIQSENNKKVYDIVGDKVAELGEKYMGTCGYSSVGGVIGCTHIDEGIELRNRYGKMFFLIPGYGAQGGAANDVAIYLKNGNGGVVNSSRGILLAYKGQEDGEKFFEEYARKETLRMREDIRNATKL
jgi:orotidine-5'-phosphate decarboxylase